MAENMVVKRLDLRGEAWPYPAMYAKASLAKMNPGEIVEVLSDAMCTLGSLPDAMNQAGHKVLKMESPQTGLFLFTIQRKAW